MRRAIADFNRPVCHCMMFSSRSATAGAGDSKTEAETSTLETDDSPSPALGRQKNTNAIVAPYQEGSKYSQMSGPGAGKRASQPTIYVLQLLYFVGLSLQCPLRGRAHLAVRIESLEDATNRLLQGNLGARVNHRAARRSHHEL
jgi:hypothetical protein